MLGILLIYFIGKRFYDLAEEYDQSKWLFAILSIIIYYASGILVLAIIAVLDMAVFGWGFNWESNFGISLLALPIGLLTLWGFYTLLENRWKKSVVVVKDEINDIGKPAEGE
ncbi:hypothetical protein GSB9_01264 [Flavobacteriaceae bacterium GSB9]|nr:hypothetical protein GSB9_01264 [Flavobacteriaceae bacterium GSB9]